MYKKMKTGDLKWKGQGGRITRKKRGNSDVDAA